VLYIRIGDGIEVLEHLPDFISFLGHFNLQLVHILLNMSDLLQHQFALEVVILHAGGATPDIMEEGQSHLVSFILKLDAWSILFRSINLRVYFRVQGELRQTILCILLCITGPATL